MLHRYHLEMEQVGRGSLGGSLQALSGYFQVPVCTPGQLDCVKEIELEDPACLPECSGVSITNVQENSNDMDQIIGSDYLKLVKQYERYEYLNKTLQISSGCKNI